MRKIWLVAKNTYWLNVRSGTFLMLTLGLPLLMVAAGGMAALQAQQASLPATGYVDQSGKLSPVGDLKFDGEMLQLTAYPDIASAQLAQSDNKIDAFIVIPDGYFQGEPVRYYGKEAPQGKVQNALKVFMRRSLRPDIPRETMNLVVAPTGNLNFFAAEDGTKIKDGFAVIIRIVFPFLLAFLFGFLLLTNIGQMGAATVREKDQRVMEIVLTSLAAWELVAGKIVGLTFASLTQVAVWTFGGILALALALAKWGAGDPILVPVDIVGWGLAIFLPTYFLFATLAAGIGIAAGNSRQAQQLAGLFGLVAMAPFMVIAPIINSPNGSLALGLSLFPLTAPMISVMRMSLTTVPTWQPLTAIFLTLVTFLACVWLVTRLFRLSMLLYGQPLRPGAIWRTVRSTKSRTITGGKTR